MLKYFSINGKGSSVAITSLVINLIYYMVFEILFVNVVNVSGIWGALSAYPVLYKTAEGIIIIQAIAFLALNLYLAFRQKGVMLYDDYMEIQDGILFTRLFCKRKIKYDTIKLCEVRRRKDVNTIQPGRNSARRNADIVGFIMTHLFISFSYFEPFCAATNSQLVVEITIRKQKQIILEVENPEEFVLSVRGRSKDNQ